MMISKRTAALLSLALTVSLLLSSCAKRAYRDDLDCDDIAEKLKSPTLEYEEYDEEYLEFFFDDTSLHDDFCIIYSNDTNDITEMGIFHTKSAQDAEKLKVSADAYLSDMRQNQRAFIESYAPEELPKLDSAEVRIFGNYVIYSISEDNEKIFSNIKNTLRIK